MKVSDIKQLKERDGMTNEQISESTGIPLFIVDGIFSGEIEEPKYMTPREFEEFLTRLGCDIILMEVIDGKIHAMSTPSRMHQFLSMEISFAMKSHINKNGGKCHIYTAPFGVRLFADDETWVEPDVLVICKKNIMTDSGCDGAPDLIVEIVSPNNVFHDYVTKLVKYQQAGVREYWIVDPINERITLYHFQEPVQKAEYTYEDTICSNVLEVF